MKWQERTFGKYIKCRCKLNRNKYLDFFNIKKVAYKHFLKKKAIKYFFKNVNAFKSFLLMCK